MWGQGKKAEAGFLRDAPLDGHPASNTPNVLWVMMKSKKFPRYTRAKTDLKHYALYSYSSQQHVAKGALYKQVCADSNLDSPGASETCDVSASGCIS